MSFVRTLVKYVAVGAIAFWLGFHQSANHRYPLVMTPQENIGQVYKHVTIPLDGRTYIHCTFDDVHFIYFGLGPIIAYQNIITGVNEFTVNAQIALDFIDNYNIADPAQGDDPGPTPKRDGPDPQDHGPQHAQEGTVGICLSGCGPQSIKWQDTSEAGEVNGWITACPPIPDGWVVKVTVGK